VKEEEGIMELVDEEIVDRMDSVDKRGKNNDFSPLCPCSH